MKSRKIYVCFFSILFIFAVGCSRKVADPPRVRSDLVLQIFQALDRENHEEVLLLINKFRTLEPHNSFIPLFETVERTNLDISKAEKAYLAGNAQKASAIIDDAVERFGQSPPLNYAMEKIDEMEEMEKLLAKMKHPRSAKELKTAAERFKVLARKNGCSGIFLSYPEQRVADAVRMQERERYLARFDLVCDLVGLARESASDTLRAQIHVEEEKK